VCLPFGKQKRGSPRLKESFSFIVDHSLHRKKACYQRDHPSNSLKKGGAGIKNSVPSLSELGKISWRGEGKVGK